MPTPPNVIPIVVRPLGINFRNGTPGVDGEPYCFTYSDPNTSVSFDLGSFSPSGGCSLVFTVFNINSTGTLSTIPVPPVATTSVPDGSGGNITVYTLTMNLTTAPIDCYYFSLVVTISCPTTPARMVASDEFKICLNCPTKGGGKR